MTSNAVCFNEKEIEKLYKAISDNDLESLRGIVTKENVNAVFNGLSPLGYAVFKNCDCSMIEELISMGANINYADDYMTNSVERDLNALVLACKQKQYDVFQLLINLGGDVDVRNFQGCPLLHLACKNDIRFVKLLLTNGADPNALCIDKNNALHASISGKAKFDVINLLLKYGTNHCMKNMFSVTPEEQALALPDVDWTVREALSRITKEKRKGTLKRKIDECNLDDQRMKLLKAEKKLKTADHNYKTLVKKLQKSKEAKDTASKACIEIRKDIAKSIDVDCTMFGQNLECPVCFMDFKPGVEIYQCNQGHVICGSCSKQPSLRCCPQCRVPFDMARKSRNRILEDIICNVRSH